MKIEHITFAGEQMKVFRLARYFALMVVYCAAAGACSAQQPEKKAETPAEHSTMTAEQHAAMHGEHAFEAGDFSTPAFVHLRDMPGTATMAKNKALIHYTYGELPRGWEVRISTADAESRAAVAEFLQAQRKEHHATGN